VRKKKGSDESRGRLQGLSESGLGRFDGGERRDRRGEGAEQNRGEKEASAAREGAAEEEALDAAVQVAEIAQAPAGLVERKGRAGGHAGTAPDFISGGLSRLGGGR